MRTHGAYAEKLHGGAMQSIVLDVVACYRGLFISLEVKRPGQELTPLQSHVVDKIKASRGIALRVESVQDVATILNDIDVTMLTHGGGYGN